VAVEFKIKSPDQSSAPSDASNFGDLDSQVQRSSYSGLAMAATVYASVFFLAYMADLVTHSLEAGRVVFLPLFDTITAAIAIGYALFIRWGCTRVKCTSCQFTPMAISFLIVSSFAIAIQCWGWERETLFGIETVSWVGVWLVAYPAVVTLAPRTILLGSLGAWATVPFTAGLSLILHGAPADFPGSPWMHVVRLSIPVLLCVGIGTSIAYRVFCLARDISKARRLGSYELIDKIGEGGMGEVWKARHRLLARPAAVKLIHPESLGMTSDQTSARLLLRRFEREAQATAQLTSPHSVVLYDFGTTDVGAFYYVMELLEGRDLKSLVRDTGPVSAERAVHFLRAACDSLADAHHRGLVHRDIKPANLFTCRRGREFDFLKVLDFGLVKSVREKQETMTQLTGEGVTSGTPGFMAPEMVTGEAPVDGRADIYALGCVAYWLLTGKLVFDGNTPMAILIQHAKETPAMVSSRTEIPVPEQLEAIIHMCLAKHPDDRPQSAQELGDMLAEVADTLPTWTRDDAERWWRANLPNLHSRPLDATLDSGATTVVNA